MRESDSAEEFSREFAKAVIQKNGSVVQKFLSCDFLLKHSTVLRNFSCSTTTTTNNNNNNKKNSKPFDEIFEKVVRACEKYASVKNMNEFTEAYDVHSEAFSSFIKEFKQREEADEVIWMINAMKQMCRDSRLLAEKADAVARKQGKKATRLEACGAQLMQAYRCSSQTSTREKKLAQLRIVNELFKIYFELNALHLCKNLVNAVNLPTFLPFEQSFPSSEKVTYHFYVGRLAVFDDDYEQASVHLKYAFEKCPSVAVKNKTACLKYLVPVMLSLGYVPSGKLFKKYAQALKPYEDVCEAVRTGKLGLLETALDRRKARFVREGTYLVFEKLRLYSLRTLFKKIAEIQKDLEPEKANQVKLEMLSTAARLVSSNNNKNNNNSTSSTELLTYDLDEVECGVSELIHRRMVKGYISHKSRVVVLSKTDAFPKLSLIVANNSTM